MEEFIKTVAGVGADFILDTLNFRGETRDRFMEFLKSYDPDLVLKYEELYQTNYYDKNYAVAKKKIRQQIS